MKIAIAQMTSTPDVEQNCLAAKKALQQAKDESCQLIIFPECALCWAQHEVTIEKARSLDEWEKILLPYAAEFQIACVWGGLQVIDNGKIYNTSLAYSPEGKLLARYEKTHLFQLFIQDKINVDETKTYAFGRSGAVSFELDDFTFGLTICYDLRFPELFREYAGHDAIICTAAFTKKTGRAHWEPLLRARAIENQCYILAAAQCGVNELNGIHTYGHSMSIDPWGKITEEAQQQANVIFTTLSKKTIANHREILPALKNRRI